MKQETKGVDTELIVESAPDLPHGSLNVNLKWHFKAGVYADKEFFFGRD